MKQLRLIWPIIIKPGMKTTKVEVRKRTSRENDELAAGCSRPETCLDSRGTSVEQKDRAKRNSAILRPDLMLSFPLWAPVFPNVNQRAE